VQSRLYSFSFAPNPEWTRMFAPQGEIRSYLERVADDFGVRDKIRLNAAMTGAECQIAYVIDALKTTREPIEVTPEAQEAYNAEIQGKLTDAVWSQGGCCSWYLDARGRNTTLWPGFTFEFRRATARFDVENYRAVPTAAPA
jgi:hypothetical protein